MAKRVQYVLLTGSTVPLLTEVIRDDFSIKFGKHIPRKIPTLAEEEAKQMLKDNKISVYIQLRDGKPAGYFRLIHHSAISGKGINEVNGMYIKEEFRGIGLSRKRYKKAFEISQAQGLSVFANPKPEIKAEQAADTLGKILKANAERAEKQKKGLGKFSRKK